MTANWRRLFISPLLCVFIGVKRRVNVYGGCSPGIIISLRHKRIRRDLCQTEAINSILLNSSFAVLARSAR